MIKKFMKLYFGKSDERDTETVLEGVEVFAMLCYAYLCILSNNKSGDLYRARIKGVAENLKKFMLPEIDAAVKALELLPDLR